MLLKLRLKMIEVGYNYGKKEQCPLDKNCGQDQQEHIFTCGAIHQEEPNDGENIDMSDIYKEDLTKMKIVGEVAQKAMRKRKELLEKLKGKV